MLAPRPLGRITLLLLAHVRFPHRLAALPRLLLSRHQPAAELLQARLERDLHLHPRVCVLTSEAALAVIGILIVVGIVLAVTALLTVPLVALSAPVLLLGPAAIRAASVPAEAEQRAVPLAQRLAALAIPVLALAAVVAGEKGTQVVLLHVVLRHSAAQCLFARHVVRVPRQLHACVLQRLGLEHGRDVAGWHAVRAVAHLWHRW
mmetsp:Transcript_14043/g.36058  ORF Transcript_14043/g.36058 Transcript_14043/m.36058 type:complete len:205 (-) Transcript_14043:8-622(-)